MQRARSFFLRSVVLGGAGIVACAQGLPSTVPLGGTESEPEPTRSPPDEQRKNPETASGTPAADPDATGDDEDVMVVDGSTVSEPDQAKAAASEASQASREASEVSQSDSDADSKAQASTGDCDDSGEGPPRCDDLETGACGAVFGVLCHDLRKRAKPRVATAIAECLRERNRTSECAQLEECIDRGLKLACVRPRDTEICRAALERCGKPTRPSPWHGQTRCERGLAALVKSERARVAECLENGCDLERCFTESGDQQPAGLP